MLVLMLLIRSPRLRKRQRILQPLLDILCARHGLFPRRRGGVMHPRLKHFDEDGEALVGGEVGWRCGELDDGCYVSEVEEEEDLWRFQSSIRGG